MEPTGSLLCSQEPATIS